MKSIGLSSIVSPGQKGDDMFALHRTLIGSAFIAVIGLAGAPAQAQPSSGVPVASAPAVANGDARAPYAWTDFCKRMPSECRVDEAITSN